MIVTLGKGKGLALVVGNGEDEGALAVEGLLVISTCVVIKQEATVNT